MACRYSIIQRLKPALFASIGLVGACRATSFGGQTPTKNQPIDPAQTSPATDDQVPATPGASNPSINTSSSSSPGSSITTTTASQHPCSSNYAVKASSNPYLAGVPAGAGITYTIGSGDGPNPTDTAPDQAPVFVTPIGNCMAPGRTLTFSVSGTATYAAGVAPTSANGNIANITTHQKNATYGKSNITAPFNSLIGVFLDNSDPSNKTPPPALDFSQQAARDYESLSPMIGQVFYIGTGKTSRGQYHQVVVPAGATRLYFATMDAYQWNNNSGNYTGAILSDAAP